MLVKNAINEPLQETHTFHLSDTKKNGIDDSYHGRIFIEIVV